MSFPSSPGPERYHSIDIRPSNDSDGIMSPPNAYPPMRLADPFSSQTNLTTQAQAFPQSGPHAHFASDATSGQQQYLTPMQMPLGDGRSYRKMDEEKGGSSANLSRNSSYDIFNQMRVGENFDTRNATEAHLTFAEGDFVQTRAGRLYAYLLNLSIVTRWILYIVPFAALLWIPGALGLTAFPNAEIWHVKLLWWSLWTTTVWVGWWGALAMAMLTPKILRVTIGMAARSTRHFIGWVENLERTMAFYAWSLGIWISYQPLINSRISTADKAEFQGSANALDLIAKLLFGIMLCSATLLAEKFAIQFIAYKFHQRSYADRIAEQKIQVKTLVTLYAHSSNIPGRNDTLRDDKDTAKGLASVNPRKALKNLLKGVRSVAEEATTALGNVASEIVGSSTLQPSSPEAKVYTALSSANKTRLLARRLFYSFRQEGASVLVAGDIARFFPDMERAEMAFSLFDQDGNGDVTREELELACLDVHREIQSLTASMRDIDSAVGRLDNVLMSLYFVVAALIMAVALDASFTSVLTGAGTLVLGLSWLIGGSAAEVLSSIIFLFIKHPYDIGDTVDIEGKTYTVKEMRLLSTVLVDSTGVFTQAPHSSLTAFFIRNHRRSGPESEPFEFDVEYSTTFEKIEDLRSKMLAFVESRRRDFLPSFDVSVKDIPDQEKMTLAATIKYKSNNHLSTLKAKRRNQWVCALKHSLLEAGIYGPAGNPTKPPSGPTQYTLVPWEEAKPDPKMAMPMPDTNILREPILPRTNYELTDANAVLMDNQDEVFGETEDMKLKSPHQPTPRSRPTRPTIVTPGMPSTSSASPVVRKRPSRNNTKPMEEFEMRPGGSAAPS
ncbi:hypothetical protein FRB95_007122 [Tulasnella sp. JGI-2019a]|nr:hypothetical protein FRB95_007122 [Tulasnella sp. JGI-2019a]